MKNMANHRQVFCSLRPPTIAPQHKVTFKYKTVKEAQEARVPTQVLYKRPARIDRTQFVEILNFKGMRFWRILKVRRLGCAREGRWLNLREEEKRNRPERNVHTMLWWEYGHSESLCSKDMTNRRKGRGNRSETGNYGVRRWTDGGEECNSKV